MTTKNASPVQTLNEQIQIEIINGKEWFLAKDVCDILGFKNCRSALKKLDDDEKLMIEIFRTGQTRKMNFINESGLYHLIFKSRKIKAKKVFNWATDELLPSNLKIGASKMSFRLKKMPNCKANRTVIEFLKEGGLL